MKLAKYLIFAILYLAMAPWMLQENLDDPNSQLSRDNYLHHTCKKKYLILKGEDV